MHDHAEVNTHDVVGINTQQLHN